jgi:hypothetical protein
MVVTLEYVVSGYQNFPKGGHASRAHSPIGFVHDVCKTPTGKTLLFARFSRISINK